jgi:peptide/nickel transport system substrate-binding protein
MKKLSCRWAIVSVFLLMTAVAVFASGKSEAMVVGIASTVRSLDPRTIISGDESALIMEMYDTLLTYDRQDFNKLAPCLAERWEIKDNGLTWTIYLRKGVKFTSGNTLTADDVIFSFLRGQDARLGKAYKPYLLDDWNEAITRIDDYTVRFRLKTPFAVFGKLLINTDSSIVDSKALKLHMTADDPNGTKYLNDHSLGTGPFTLKEWKRDELITLVSNPGYWGIPIRYFRVPKYETLLIRNIPEASVQKMMLDRGEIQMAWNLTGDMIAEYVKNPGFYLTKIPVYVATGIVMNPAAGILGDENIRNAIRWAIDYDSIINSIFLGYALRLDRPFFSPFIGSLGAKETPLYYYDLAKAKYFMARSSHPDGGEITLVIGTGGGMGAPWEIIAQKEASDLAKIGIRVKIEQYDWSVVDEKTEGGKYEALQYWGGVSFPEAAGCARSYANSKRSYYLRVLPAAENAEIDALCNQADLEGNLQKREQIYRQVSEMHAKVGPYANVAQQMQAFVFPINVKGFDGNPDTQNFDYATFYYSK